MTIAQLKDLCTTGVVLVIFIIYKRGMNFFELGARERLGGKNIWLKLDDLLNWESIRKRLTGLYRCETEDRGGERPYDVVKMFKATLLGQWHGLSDPELEHSLRVRVDFIVFCGFGMDESVPDETTLCRFRNRLTEAGLLDKLLAEVNEQLEEHGLKVKESCGAVVDATIIESAARPRRVFETREPTQGEQATANVVVVEESVDADARWLKKGAKSYFGYRGYLRTDVEDGYIEAVQIHPANQAEVNKLSDMIDTTIKRRRYYADKGFSSAENREQLKKHRLRDGLMHKAVRGKKLTPLQRWKNRFITKRRWIIEQGFGTLKRKFRMRRSSYYGVTKVQTQLGLKAICLNLLKAANKIQLRA